MVRYGELCLSAMAGELSVHRRGNMRSDGCLHRSGRCGFARWRRQVALQGNTAERVVLGRGIRG
ncbi:MAG: hypothetical protein ACLTSZ_04550 [Lachnospiraceae bacterium]